MQGTCNVRSRLSPIDLDSSERQNFQLPISIFNFFERKMANSCRELRRPADLFFKYLSTRTAVLISLKKHLPTVGYLPTVWYLRLPTLPYLPTAYLSLDSPFLTEPVIIIIISSLDSLLLVRGLLLSYSWRAPGCEVKALSCTTLTLTLMRQCCPYL